MESELDEAQEFGNADESSDVEKKTSKAPWALVGVLFVLILLTGVGIYLIWMQSKSRLGLEEITVQENQGSNVLPLSDDSNSSVVSGTLAPSPTIQITTTGAATPKAQSTGTGTITPKPSVTPTSGLNLQANPTKTPSPTPTKSFPISN